MGETALVETQVADAIALVRELDKAGLAPTLAVWLFYDEVQQWRLLLAGPSFDELLAKEQLAAYRAVVDARARISLRH